VRRLVIGLLVLAAASGAAGALAASPDFRAANEIVLTRADGTVIPVKQSIRVWCGPWEQDVRKPSIHVRVGTRSGFWTLTAVVADVKRKPVVRFPHSFVFDKPSRAQPVRRRREERAVDRRGGVQRPRHLHEGPVRQAPRHPLQDRCRDGQRVLGRHADRDPRLVQRARLKP